MSAAVTITNHLPEMDFQTIHEFIRNSYWAKNIPVETTARRSESIALRRTYHGNKKRTSAVAGTKI